MSRKVLEKRTCSLPFLDREGLPRFFWRKGEEIVGVQIYLFQKISMDVKHIVEHMFYLDITIFFQEKV